MQVDVRNRPGLATVTVAALSMLLALSGCKGDKGETGSEGPPGPAGPAGEACTLSDTAAGKVITCPDGTTVTLTNGQNGEPGADGTSCTVADNGDGTKTITCGTTSVTVSNGAAGENGQPGEPGADGTSCTVADNGDGTKTITCGTTSVTVSNGAAGEAGTDGQNCTLSEVDGVKTITCPGGSTVTISDGKDAVLPAGAGAKVTIQAATLTDTTATVTFKITDSKGNPIDLLAEKLSVRFMLASRDATSGVYTSLYTSTATGAPYVDGAGATQQPKVASNPNAGSKTGVVPTDYAQVSDGVFTYTFPTAGRAAANLALDHTVSVFGARTFDGVSYPYTASYHFNPTSGQAVAKREVVSDAACNKCHDKLTAHGTRRGLELCLTCHSPQTIDPETSNTMDMRVMVHKIHRGAQAGDSSTNPWKYEVVGHQQHYLDYSHVSFAAPGNTVRNCTVCHQGAQADNYKNKPSFEACASCHYELDTAPATVDGDPAHGNGAACNGCHDGSIAPSVEVAHSPLWDSASNTLFTGKNLVVKIEDVTNVVAGQAPVLEFTITVDGQPFDLIANPTKMGTFRFSIAGPTTDFAGPGKPAAVGYVQTAQLNTAAALTAAKVTEKVAGTPGRYTVELPALAADAAGTMAFGTEAYIKETIGTVTKNWNAKDASVVYKAIGGGTVKARREIVDDAKCNACHVDLGFHSNSSRHNARYCAFCHNPNNVNEERVSRFELAQDGSGDAFSIVPESVNLSTMVHKIHMGGALANPYTLGGNPSPSATNPAGNQNTIEALYPGDLGNCLGCHKTGTYGLPAEQLLPTKMETWTCSEDAATGDTGATPARTDNNFCDAPFWNADPTKTMFIPPQTNACASCHDSTAAKGHMMLNTYMMSPTEPIETCAVCHGPGKDLDVVKVHQPKP